MIKIFMREDKNLNFNYLQKHVFQHKKKNYI